MKKICIACKQLEKKAEVGCFIQNKGKMSMCSLQTQTLKQQVGYIV